MVFLMDCVVYLVLVVGLFASVKGDDVADWKDEKTDVVHLTNDNYDEVMSKNPSVLLMLYKKGCRHCKKMKPIWEEAAKAINTEDQAPGKLAALDCLVNEETCVKIGMGAIDQPEAKYFKDGKMAFDYHGKKRLVGIVKFMKDPHEPRSRPLGPPWTDENVVHLKGKELKKFVKEEEKALVFFYAPWCGHCEKMKPAYGEAAKYVNSDKELGKMAAMDCMADENKKHCERYGADHFPTLIYFKNGKQLMAYDGKRGKEDLIEFMEEPEEWQKDQEVAKKKEAGYNVPWDQEDKNVVHLTEETFQPFLENNSHVLVFFYAPWCGHCKKAKPAYGEAAATLNKDKLGFRKLAAVDCTVHKEVCEKNDIDGYPTLLMFQDGKELETYSKARTAEEILKYMDKFLKIEETVKLVTTPTEEEPVPVPIEPEAPVKTEPEGEKPKEEL